MTLGDLLVHLRARAGGLFYSDVAEATGIPVLRIVRAERTTSVPDLSDAELARLADYFGTSIEELQQAKRQTRAEVTAYLGGQEKAHAPARLQLRGAGVVSGPVVWRDRHAVALRQPGGAVLVVYRTSIERWG
ncbi:MAG: helix-turn-helix transcriptional regulator [Chloroflexi bacterium]|nr:helix-turn-helix transcriptional regulator [Chloroflexota bacterium]